MTDVGAGNIHFWADLSPGKVMERDGCINVCIGAVNCTNARFAAAKNLIIGYTSLSVKIVSAHTQRAV